MKDDLTTWYVEYNQHLDQAAIRERRAKRLAEKKPEEEIDSVDENDELHQLEALDDMDAMDVEEEVE